jgi:hypothetical protein
MAIRVGKREYMALLVTVATAWPWGTKAQQSPVIGFLTSRSGETPICWLPFAKASKTASPLGLDVPSALLLRADEMME